MAPDPKEARAIHTATLDQIAEEQKTQRGQLIGITVMVGMLAIMLAVAHKQLLDALPAPEGV